MVFSMSEMVSSISSSVSLLSSILVNVRLKIVMISSSLVIHEVNVFLTVRMLVSYLDRRLLICFKIHFLMMYLIMVEFPLLSLLLTMVVVVISHNGLFSHFTRFLYRNTPTLPYFLGICILVGKVGKVYILRMNINNNNKNTQ